MSFTSMLHIKVSLDFGTGRLPVGRLAIREGEIYFEYDGDFLDRGLEISPLRLSLQAGVRKFDRALFEGLPGVFNDSLPDGWGRLLLDRSMRAQGFSPELLSPLDRLGRVGSSGMGALVYHPDYVLEIGDTALNLDRLAFQAMQVLNGEAEDVLGELLALNGSSAGARPKAMIGVDENRERIIYGANKLPANYTPWLVKFPNVNDGPDAGAIEYVYGLMAVEAGVAMTKTHLFPAQKGAGYFATARFDRAGDRRIHTHTACGALHSDFRTPSLDYEDLLALTGVLTRDVREVEKMFALAVFNVLAHNRDDHAKNFTFLMDERGEWTLSPAYDLTFSSGPRGEQSTMAMGEGRNPNKANLVKLGRRAKLEERRIMDIMEQTSQALSRWAQLAKTYAVSNANIKWIGDKLARLQAGK